jgi:predicted DNA-binding transcriptional regulator AlpA
MNIIYFFAYEWLLDGEEFSSGRTISVAPMPEEIVGIAEIAEACGVTKRTAQKYARRADFPEPLGRIAAGPVWRRAEIEAWAKEYLPLPVGRPRREGHRG